MSVRSKILEFYSEVLATLMVNEDDESGALFYQVSGESPKTQIVVGDKLLRLPRAEYMREPNDDYIYFHPLGEDTSLGESPVFQQLLNLVIAKLTLSLMSVPSTIIQIGNLHSTGADVNGKLTSKQVEIIAAISGTDNLNDKIADKFSKVVAAASKDPTTRPIKITIRRNAKRYGESTVYRRAAIVTFPLFTEIVKKSTLGEDTIHGQKFSKYEMRLMINIYKTLFPNCDVEDHYSVFSDSPHAPNFTALMLAYADLTRPLSKIVRAFEKYLPDYDNADVGDDWILSIAKIPEYASVIPTARGNEGIVLDDRGHQVSKVDKDDDEVRSSRKLETVREVERTTRSERSRFDRDDHDDDDLVDIRDNVPVVESRDGRFAAIPLSESKSTRSAPIEEDRSPPRSSPSNDLAAALREAMRRPRDRDEDDDEDDRRRSRRDRDRDDDRSRRRSRDYDDDYEYEDRRDRADDFHRAALRSRAIDDRDSRRDRDRGGRHRRDDRGYSRRR